VIGLALDLIVVVTAAVGVAAAVRGSATAGLVLLLPPIAIGLQLQRSRTAARPEWMPLGNIAAGPRAVSVIAVAVAFALVPAGPEQRSAAALAVFVSLCCLATEPLIGRASRYTVPVAAHLPAVAKRAPDRELGSLAVLTGVCSSALGAVLLALHVSAWWWLLVVLLAAVPLGLVVVLAARRIIAGRRQRRAVPVALARYRPDFLLYTGRPDDASYQLTMWLDYFRRTGLRFAIVTRYHLPALALAELVSEPVVEARSAADLQAVVPGSARAVFYANASARNGDLVADRRLRHVYVGHGDSDKPPSFNPTHALYDEIFTAGPAAARRYPAHGVAIAPDKFRVVGRPQVERVQAARGPIVERRPPVVLYAPTWRGHVEESALSSLPVGERIVSSLLARGTTVIFRPHPFSRAQAEDAALVTRIAQLLEADAERTGRLHLWGAAAETDRGIGDCLNASDAMVADVSSVVSDYLFSGKPFAMVAVPSSPDAFAQEYPVARAAYVVRGDLGDLEDKLDAMLGADPLAEQRSTVRADYLGTFAAEGYAEHFVDAVRAACVAGPVQAVVSPDPTDLAGGTEPAKDPGTGTAGARASRPPALLGGAAGGMGAAVLELASAVMAAAALVMAILGAPGWLVAVTVLLATGELLASSSVPLRSPGRWPRLLGYAEAARVALLVAGPLAAVQTTAAAASAVATDTGAGVALGWLLAAGLASACLLTEDRIRAGWEGGLVVRRLPGTADPIAPLVPRGVVPLLGFVLAATMAVFVAIPLVSWLKVAGWLAAAGALVLTGLTGVVLGRALRRADGVDHAGETLRAALSSYAPQFLVYSAATTGAKETVAPWLPVLAELDRPWVIVARSRSMLDEIDRECRVAEVEVPLILRPTQRGVEDVAVPSLAVAAYVDDAPRNTHLIERRDLVHVRLNLVRPVCHPVHAAYDAVLVPPELTTQRYAAAGVVLPASKLVATSDPTTPDSSAADRDAFLTAFAVHVTKSPKTGH
jgi:hypothetical protein